MNALVVFLAALADFQVAVLLVFKKSSTARISSHLQSGTVVFEARYYLAQKYG